MLSTEPDDVRVIKTIYRLIRVQAKADYVRLAQYELRDELGSGQYGVVRAVRCSQTNKDYAMKIIR